MPLSLIKKLTLNIIIMLNVAMTPTMLNVVILIVFILIVVGAPERGPTWVSFTIHALVYPNKRKDRIESDKANKVSHVFSPMTHQLQ
jgi:hypothetical protein